MKLSIIELSQHLGVAQKTIERWIKQGKLPVSQKGAHYQFHIKELEKWAFKHNIKLHFSEKNGPDEEKDSYLALSAAVRNGGIYSGIQGNDVKDVLNACIQKITRIPNDFKADLLNRLIEREKALSTGIGNGIAIPHPREQLSYLKHPMVAVCFLDAPLEYRAIDNRPVSILFFLLCPSLDTHLHLLSALSLCLKNNRFAGFLKSTPDPDVLVQKIETLEKANLL